VVSQMTPLLVGVQLYQRYPPAGLPAIRAGPELELLLLPATGNAGAAPNGSMATLLAKLLLVVTELVGPNATGMGAVLVEATALATTNS